MAPICASAENISVLVVGDSLSAAFNMPVEKGWVHLMRDELSSRQPTVSIANASVSGATTAAGLQFMPAALAQHKPDIVILELGANDGLQGKPLAHIRRNLERLIEQALASDAQVLLVGIRIPPNYGSAYAEPFFAQYAALATQYELSLVPFLLEGVAGVDGLTMSDGLHPRAQAQPIIKNTVLQGLQIILDAQ